jgi:hypothetical protein
MATNNYIVPFNLSQYFFRDERGFLIMTHVEAYSILGGVPFDFFYMKPEWMMIMHQAKKEGLVSEDRWLPLPYCAFSPAFFKRFHPDGGAGGVKEGAKEGGKAK